MPNKTPTITMPVASDMNVISFDVDAAGVISNARISANIPTSDPEVSHSGECSTIATTAFTHNMATMVTEALAALKSDKGF